MTPKTYFTRVVAILGRECRESNPGETDSVVDTLIDEISRENGAVVFTHGSVCGQLESGEQRADRE